MSITMNYVAKIAAVLAGAALVLSSFAFAFAAQAQAPDAQSHANVNASFNRDLTIGSTGTDVIALQNLLISKGFSIPAGATGYFGGQTQAALSRYQASLGIVPAAGYFGPITRGRVHVPAPTPVPSPSHDDENENEEDEASDAIDDARDSLSDARDEVEDADDDGDDIGDAEDLLDEAEDTLDDADEAFDDKDYDDVMDLVDDAEDLIDEALDEIDSKSASDTSKVDSSTSRNKAGDVGTFSFEFTVKANDGDIEFEESDVDYDVIGPANNGTSAELVRISGDADEDGGVFTIEEGDEATFSFDVTIAVDADAENGTYRVNVDRILGVGIDETSGSLLLTND